MKSSLANPHTANKNSKPLFIFSIAHFAVVDAETEVWRECNFEKSEEKSVAPPK